MQNINIIIDFDSTIIKLEALDELAQICLQNKNPEKIIQLKKITELGMEGKLDFQESLAQRLDIFTPQLYEIKQLILLLQNNISNSFLQNKAFLKQYQKNIYIISGGFKEYIVPIANELNILTQNVFANEFKQKNGQIIGYKESLPLAQNQGKVKQTKLLNLNPGKTRIVGDGHTDFEIKKYGYASKFFLFTENIERKNLIQYADEKTNNFGSIIKLLQ